MTPTAPPSDDAPEPARVAALRRAGGRLGVPHEHHAVLASTNDRALAWLDAGAPSGALVTADAQTRGRGRRGRSFHSDPGAGLYASVVLRFPAGTDVSPLALVVGLSLADALGDVGVCDVRLKWPNDLFVPAGKLGGVLCEAVWRGGAPAVVAGFGINVHAAPDLGEDAPYRAARVADAAGGRPVGRARLLAAALDRLETDLVSFERGGFAALRGRYLQRSCTVGRVVTLEGGETVRVLDVDEGGALVVRGGAGGRRRIAVGEVSLPLDGRGW